METEKVAQMDQKCPICDDGFLEPRIQPADVMESGGATPIDLHYSVCSACNIELSSGDQLAFNKANMLEHRARKENQIKTAELFAKHIIWTHNRGQDYKIIGLSNLDTTKPGWVPTVTYHPVEDDEKWYSRPIVDFIGSCTPRKEDRCNGQG